MRKRVLCVWLPHWPLQETLARRPEWKGQAVVLYSTGGRGGQAVVARSRPAAARGVRPGMPLAQARALLDGGPPAQYEPFAARTHRAALSELAAWCLQFSPVVAIEEAETPECLLLDIDGCAHLFGGEQRLAEQVVRMFEERGLSTHVAVADTVGAAWAVAHYQKQAVTVLPPGRHETALQPLPVEALRLAPAAAGKLRQLDLGTVGRLQALPRVTLPSRFGVEILRRLDQALGRQPELLRAIKPFVPVEAAWDFLYPTTDRWILEAMLRQLLEQLVETVRAKNRGVQSLLCRFGGEKGQETSLALRLLRPTACADRLFELLRLRLDATRLGGDVCGLHLQAEVAPLEVARWSLFDDVDQLEQHQELTALVERLSSRLGPGAVDLPHWSLNPQPELAIAYTPALEARAGAAGRSQDKNPRRRGARAPPSQASEGVAATTAVAPFRPARLARAPLPVEVVSVYPDGPPVRFFWDRRAHQVAHCWGPERIETSWWLGQHVRRDYFRVETTTGLRFWLFRQRDNGGWFLHGIFA
jgi:protein ImuB